MANKIEVAEVNPIVFVARVAEEVGNGFYVTKDIQGYPVTGFPTYITLTESDEEPEITHKLGDEIHTAVVEGWDLLTVLLDIQSLVLQGFTLDTDRSVFGDFKSFTMVKRAPVKLDLKPDVTKTEDKPAKGKRTAKATKGETE